MIVKRSYLQDVQFAQTLIHCSQPVLSSTLKIDHQCTYYRTYCILFKKGGWVITGNFQTPLHNLQVKSCWCSMRVLCMNNNNSFKNGWYGRAKLSFIMVWTPNTRETIHTNINYIIKYSTFTKIIITINCSFTKQCN